MASGTRASLAVALCVLVCGVARADSVGQVATAKYLTDDTVKALTCRVDPIEGTNNCNDCIGTDPEFCRKRKTDGGVGDGGAGTSDRAAIRPGDILTFRITFTPVPNGQIYGGGGYITEYVPPGTEVVGVRMVDSTGRTVKPRRAGPMASGWGTRGDKSWSTVDASFKEGTIAQVYCDTGIFYSTDPRTAQKPADKLLDVNNGLLLAEPPTGVDKLADLVGATKGQYYAHNTWDLHQTYAFGIKSSHNGGQGNTPHGYGSAVAGPDSWYKFDATPGATPTVPALKGAVGPWKRIRYPGSETCTGNPATDGGVAVRVGVPTDKGVDVSPDRPLPAGTNAVRFAIGELIVGAEYYAEISLRVVSVPIHPTLGNANCAEVFGGDATYPEVASGSKGKDSAWRYFLPAPTCTNIDVFFGISVDKKVALEGDTLTYTIQVINLSRDVQKNIVITDNIDAANGAKYVSATGDKTVAAPGAPVNGVLTWPTIPKMDPGEKHVFTVTVQGGKPVTINQAFYNSDTIKGYRAVAFTLTEPTAIISQSKSVSPKEAKAGDTLTYTITVRNTGTADAKGGQVHETLPAGWTIVAGSSKVDGSTAIADPASNGNTHVWSAGIPDVAPGKSVTLSFDVKVPATAKDGVYTNTFLSAFGDNESKTFSTARVAIGLAFSAAPTVSAPIRSGDTDVSGSSTEADGTEIRVLVNGIERGKTTVTAGKWSVSKVPAMFAGQHVTAFAKAPGKAESDESKPVVVEASSSKAGSGGGDGSGGGGGDGGASGDGGSGGDGGGSGSGSDGGCCHIGGGAGGLANGALWCAALALLLWAGRRRRRRRRCIRPRR